MFLYSGRVILSSHNCTFDTSIEWKVFVVSLRYISLIRQWCLFVAVEGLKAVEIEKCKQDISEIKDQIWTAQKKFVDFNRMR